jgi:small subunit ribosomal protein S16
MQRLGRRNAPFYRISAIDQQTRRDGRVIEQLGWYDPIAKDAAKQLNLNEERIKHWLSVGAQPSETVRDMLAKRNLVDTVRWEADRKNRRECVAANKAAAAAAPPPDPKAKPKPKPKAG